MLPHSTGLSAYKRQSKVSHTIVVFSAVAHVPYNLYFVDTLNPLQGTSVMWSLTMGLLALIIIKSNHQFVLKIIAVMVCCILTHYVDWSYTVPLWIAGFGVFYKKPLLQFVSFTVTGVVFYSVPMILRHGIDHITFSTLYIMGIFIAIPLILQYSGERGNRSKTIGIVFYVYYPVHLMLLHLVNVLNIY